MDHSKLPGFWIGKMVLGFLLIIIALWLSTVVFGFGTIFFGVMVEKLDWILGFDQ